MFVGRGFNRDIKPAESVRALAPEMSICQFTHRLLSRVAAKFRENFQDLRAVIRCFLLSESVNLPEFMKRGWLPAAQIIQGRVVHDHERRNLALFGSGLPPQAKALA